MRKRRIQTKDEPESSNPKLVGSGMVDCVPQTGKCLNACLECYYNSDGWFRTKDTPLFPPEDTEKIVRVNSGNDSNVDRDWVIGSTLKYKEKFYNTSLPRFDFPGPVIFTCNGRDTDYSAMIVKKDTYNLMAVRFRTNLWNLDLLYEVIVHYSQRHKIPVTITFMRYTKLDFIPEQYRLFYVYRKSILNEYYALLPEKQEEVVSNYSYELVGRCGKSWSSYCRDCGRCSKLYEIWKTKTGFKQLVTPS